jgi:hypothetical protein
MGQPSFRIHFEFLGTLQCEEPIHPIPELSRGSFRFELNVSHFLIIRFAFLQELHLKEELVLVGSLQNGETLGDIDKAK